MTDRQENAVIPVPQDAAITPWGLEPDESPIAIRSTLDRVRTIRAINNAEGQLGDLASGTVLHIRDVVQHTVEFPDEKTGEIVHAWRTIVLDTEGRGWAATSKGVYGSIRLLAVAYGNPPWDPALALVVKRFRTRQGFSTGLKLDLAELAED